MGTVDGVRSGCADGADCVDGIGTGLALVSTRLCQNVSAADIFIAIGFW